MSLERRIDETLREAERQAKFFAVKTGPFHKETAERCAAIAQLLRDVRRRIEVAAEVRVTSPSTDRPDTMWLGCGLVVSIRMDGGRPYLVARPTETLAVQ